MENHNREHILTALEAIRDAPTASEQEVIALLESRGFSHSRAAKLATLVPLAFGRVLIAHVRTVGMSDEFALGDGPNRVERPLNREPLFVEAIRMAAHLVHHGPRELFEPAARLSPEFWAFNDALHANADLEGATLLPPEIHALGPDEWDADG